MINDSLATITSSIDYEVPNEIRSNRTEDLFQPYWITKAVLSDRGTHENEDGWISLVVFEDEKEMLEMIGDWGERPRKRVKLHRVNRK